MFLLILINSETPILLAGHMPVGGIIALVLSCLGSLGMSYFSFALRAVISATSFSIIGNICKILTILVNILLWDQHASKYCLPLQLCAFKSKMIILPHVYIPRAQSYILASSFSLNQVWGLLQWRICGGNLALLCRHIWNWSTADVSSNGSYVSAGSYEEEGQLFRSGVKEAMLP